jgi:hypothetical protein
MLAATAACVAFAALAVVGPGVAVQRALRLAVDPVLVLPLGLLQAAAFQWLAVRLDRPWVFVALVVAVDATIVLLPRGPWRIVPGPSLRGALPAFAAAVVVLVATRYGVNRSTAGGDFLIDPLSEDDVAFHAGLTWEAMLGVPTEVPGLSGVPLHYHVGSALVRAAAVRFTGMSPYDLLTRAQPVLYVLALILALRGLASALGASALVVRLVPWTVLAGDFSFLFAFDPAVRYWTDYLRGNLVLAVVLGNDVVIGLAMVLGSLVALARHESGQGRGWLWLSALLALGLPAFKVFVGAHYLLGLGLAFVLARGPRGALVVVGAASALGVFALAASGGTETILLTVDPLAVTAGAPSWFPGSARLARGVAWVAVWVLASLGLRLLGLPEAVRRLRSGGAAGAAAAIALSGWVVGLLVRMSPRDLMPGQKVFNEAARFIEQSGPFLWVFTAIALGTWIAGRRKAVVLAACALLSLPSTAQFVVRKHGRPAHVAPAGVLQAMSALSEASRPGDVVLQRPDPRFPPPPVVFIGRRVPYTRTLPYMTQFAPRPALEERVGMVKGFFETRDAEEAVRLAHRLGARFLCLYGEDRVAFDPRGVLSPLFESADARVYRIAR